MVHSESYSLGYLQAITDFVYKTGISRKNILKITYEHM